MQVCPICNDSIEDPSEDDEFIMCEGSCNSKIHRRCAGLSNSAFAKAKESSLDFICPHCQLENQADNISSLKSSVKELSEEIQALKAQMSSLLQSMNIPAAFEETPMNTISGYHKYCIVIHGIEESLKGTPRIERVKSDFESAMSSLSPLLETLTMQGICDCIRLGGYSEGCKRPLLVKLARSCDVTSILSNRSRISGGKIYVQPFMTASKRRRQKSQVLGEVIESLKFNSGDEATPLSPSAKHPLLSHH